MQNESRKRFLKTLNHQQPDQVVVDFGGQPCSTMHVSCVAALRNYYGLEKHPVKLVDPFSMTGEIEPDLLACLGVDTQCVPPYYTTFGIRNGDIAGWKEWRMHDGTVLLVSKEFTVRDDGQGGYYTYPGGDTSVNPTGHMPANGFYFDAVIPQEELDLDGELNVEDNLEEFQLLSEEELEYYRRAAAQAAKTGRGVIATTPSTCLYGLAGADATGLKAPKGIRSPEYWSMALCLCPEHMESIFARQTEVAIENLRRFAEAVGDSVDVVMTCGADFGTQRGTYISPSLFQKLYVPYYKRMNDWIHENTHWKVLKHSCGAIAPLMPLMIEAGFDCMNPVQCSAEGMDPRFLKDTFGEQIVFWGGGVDTQQVLPFGTPEEVRRQALERCEIFAPGGGFVFNTIHNIQSGTPVENMIALFDALKEFKEK